MILDTADRCCPLCGSSDARVVLSDHNRREGLDVSGRVVECQRCSMRYLSPVPARDLARLYGDGTVDPVRTPIEDISAVERELGAEPGGRARRLARTIQRSLRGNPHQWPPAGSAGGSIFDFACHSGEKLEPWYRAGWRVGGIDLNRGAIELARRRFPEGRFWCGDLRSEPVHESFDWVRSDNGLEHILEPVAYLEALRKILRPGGRVVVMVPNAAALSVRLFGRRSAVYWMPFHVNLFTRATLTEALRRAGFRDVRCHTHSPPGCWNWTLYKLLLKPGYNRRPDGLGKRLVRALKVPAYPGEVVAQWLAVGEELVAVARR